MDDPCKDAWSKENSLPIREIDASQTDGTGEEAFDPTDGVVRSIVPAPRPFAYRQPLGTPEPEPHPRRRGTD